MNLFFGSYFGTTKNKNIFSGCYSPGQQGMFGRIMVGDAYDV